MTRRYLDYNATAPVWPEVVHAVAEQLAQSGNPSSVHRSGQRARARLEEARRRLASILNCRPERLVFTSGGTEANMLALAQAAGPVLTSAVEHPSILGNTESALRIPVDADGALDTGALERQLAEVRPALVSVMAANNETGVLFDLQEVATLVRRSGAGLHVDAIQAAGKLPTSDLAGIVASADYVSLSAHKIGGPPGVGALVIGPNAPFAALQRGGGQERGHRSGTENLAGIAGFAEACTCVQRVDWAAIGAMRDHLERELASSIEGLVIAGAGARRLPNTTCLVLEGTPSALQLMILDRAGFEVSSGAACSSGKVAASHVLSAMGFAPAAAGCAIRVSLGWTTRAEDIQDFATAYVAMARQRTGAVSAA